MDLARGEFTVALWIIRMQYNRQIHSVLHLGIVAVPAVVPAVVSVVLAVSVSVVDVVPAVVVVGSLFPKVSFGVVQSVGNVDPAGEVLPLLHAEHWEWDSNQFSLFDM